MANGYKNRAILYLRGGQGIGKSTLFEFVEKFVVGLDLAFKSGSQPLISPFNAILGGKLFIYFEELETVKNPKKPTKNRDFRGQTLKVHSSSSMLNTHFFPTILAMGRRPIYFTCGCQKGIHARSRDNFSCNCKRKYKPLS